MSDDDPMLDAALADWLMEALAPVREAEDASWSRFTEETLLEKDAWPTWLADTDVMVASVRPPCCALTSRAACGRWTGNWSVAAGVWSAPWAVTVVASPVPA